MSELPNLHAEEKRLKDVANWSDERLLEKSNEYAELSLRTELSPRAREQVMKILMGISFEYSYRQMEVERLEEAFELDEDVV